MNKITVIKPEDILPNGMKRLQLVKEYTKQLKHSLVMPNESNIYSIAVQFMKEWFLDGFVDGYFRSVYINEKNIIDDFRRMTREELIKRPKPCCTIIPKSDQEFNRDNLDLYNYGSNLWNSRARFQDSFVRDLEKNVYLAVDFKLKKMQFTFRAKVQTLATAQNMAEHDKIRFRSGGTIGKYVDIDFLIPDELILALATDLGYKVEQGTIIEQTDFLCYINQKSQIPILCKFVTSMGRYQYFMKVPNMYIHISTGNVSIDEGERKGHVMMDYNVEFESELMIPAPKFFVYYSMEKREFLKEINPNTNSYSLYAFPIYNIPITNKKGWQQYLTTNYVDDNENFRKHNKVVIYFNELIGDLRNVIEYTKSIFLSPSLFMEFKLFNESHEVDINVDWVKMTITTKKFLPNINSYLVMYVDTNYVHEQTIKIRKEEKNRISTKLQAKNPRSE